VYRIPTITIADNSDASSEQDGSSDTEVNSDNDESTWSKQPFVSVAHNFDSVKITPRMPFLPSDTPVDFFTKLFELSAFCEDFVLRSTTYAPATAVWNIQPSSATLYWRCCKNLRELRRLKR